MDAYILAGGRPKKGDLLFAEAGGRPKAMIEIADRPIVGYVLDALHGCDLVDEVTVVGLPTESILSTDEVNALPDYGSIVENVRQLLLHHERMKGAGYVLIVTGDLPLISAETITTFSKQCQPLTATAYYPFLSRAIIEAEFPNSYRTYAHLREGDYTGGNLIVAHTRLAYTNADLWSQFVNARKHPLQIARLVGIRSLLRLLLRRLSIREIETLATRIFDTSFSIVVTTDATIGMDIDKSHQLQLVREYLSTHSKL